MLKNNIYLLLLERQAAHLKENQLGIALRLNITLKNWQESQEKWALSIKIKRFRVTIKHKKTVYLKANGLQKIVLNNYFE
jgi:hypothetical protein